MYSVRPNWLMRKTYSSAIWRIPTTEKKLYLTFDDGPIPEVTPWVLSTLKNYKAKATFFCIGANVEKHQDVFHQVISEGHTVGNHTFNHLNGWKTKTEEYLENVRLCSQAVQLGTSNLTPIAIGVETLLFRPPYGKMKLAQFSQLRTQHSVIMWDVLSGDFDPTNSEEKCLKNVISKTREGSIIVFHDSLKAKTNLYYALPKFLEHFSKKGFVFDSLTTGCLTGL
jgi:peptidoglycan-N-acetylglucosamine deacetylase